MCLFAISNEGCTPAEIQREQQKKGEQYFTKYEKDEKQRAFDKCATL